MIIKASTDSTYSDSGIYISLVFPFQHPNALILNTPFFFFFSFFLPKPLNLVFFLFYGKTYFGLIDRYINFDITGAGTQ